jgi:SAM-dependent methyltransferase
LVRRQLLSRAVATYAARYLTAGGVVVEAGCGSGESSTRIDHTQTALVGLDFSFAALLRAGRSPTFGSVVRADIQRLPFREGSLGGVFNLGVLEHFAQEQGVAILRECARALKPGAHMVLFWPPRFGSSRFLLLPLEGLISAFRRRRFRFFPDEPGLLRSRAHARAMLAAAGLEAVTVDFSPRDGFIHLVVVARRPRT